MFRVTFENHVYVMINGFSKNDNHMKHSDSFLYMWRYFQAIYLFTKSGL